MSQQEFLSKNAEEALGIVCDAAASLTAGEPKVSARRSDVEASTVLLLRELLVRNPECTAQNCMQKFVKRNPAALGVLRKALDHLLNVGTGDMQPQASSESSVTYEVEKLASTADDFSLPFCQLKLQVLFHEDSASEDRNSIVDAMFKTAVADSRAQKPHWVDLVALMSPDAVRQIRERAEKELFSIPILEENDTRGASQNPVSLETAKLYLAITEELASSIPDSGAPSVASTLVEKMDSLLHKILAMQSNQSHVSEHHTGPVDGQGRSTFERSLAFWFSALLRMVVIHRASFTQPSPNLKANTSQEQCRLLTSIFCIALSRLPGDVLRQFPGADYFSRAGPVEDYRDRKSVV